MMKRRQTKYRVSSVVLAFCVIGVLWNGASWSSRALAQEAPDVVEAAPEGEDLLLEPALDSNLTEEFVETEQGEEIQGEVTTRGTDVACNNATFDKQPAEWTLVTNKTADVKFSAFQRLDKTPATHSAFKKDCVSFDGQCLGTPSFKYYAVWPNLAEWQGRLCARAVQNSANNHEVTLFGKTHYIAPVVGFQTKAPNEPDSAWRWMDTKTGKKTFWKVPPNGVVNVWWHWHTSAEHHPMDYRLVVRYAKAQDQVDIRMDKWEYEKLTTKQIENIGQYVHDRVTKISDTTAPLAGYQFGLQQSGQVLTTSAQGWAWDEKFKMKPDMKMNLGSVSKMIATLTALKMVDLGKIQLTDTIGPYLKKHPSTKVSKAAIHEEVERITIYELLTMTGLFWDGKDFKEVEEADPGDDWKLALKNSRIPGKCDPSIPVKPGSPTPCYRSYQNVNFLLLRFVIEGALGLDSDPDEHPPSLVTYTQNLWMKQIGVGDMSCSANPKMRYYPKDKDIGKSKVCSSGGWRASAQDLLRVLKGIRNGQVLSLEQANLLFNTTLSSRSDKPGKTAVGWDQPGTTGRLTKGGRLAGKVQTCLGSFQQNVDMVLLINEDAGYDPCNILRNAWVKRNSK